MTRTANGMAPTWLTSLCSTWLSGLLVALLAVVPAPAVLADDDDDDDDDAAYQALTEYMSWIEAGVRYNEEDDYAFGNYTGLDDEGASVVGNGDIRWRSAWDSDTARYIRLQGLNLGLESRYLGFEYKEQGLFGVYLQYDELPRYVTDSASTFFLDDGSNNLTLPPGWVPGDSPEEMTELDANLSPLKIRMKRKTISTGVDIVLPEHFDFDVNYSHQTKRGKKLVGAVIGTSGGNPRAVVIPERVNYLTQQVDASLRYTLDDFQAEFGYYASIFTNQKDQLVWQNPYTAVSGWNPVAGWPTGQGRLHQPPDNWAQQFNVAGGYNLPMHSRITVNTAFGEMRQNDDFLPYTVNGMLDVPVGLPRDDLDGKIKTTMVDVRLVSNPMDRVNFRAGYRYDHRDNDTPKDTFLYVHNDAADQGDIESSTARVNRPYSFEIHDFETQTSVRVWERTDLAFGYEFEQTKRNLQEVSKVKEHTVSGILRSHFNSHFNTRVIYEHSWRNPTNYNYAKPLIKGFSPEHVEAELEDLIDDGMSELDLWENHPLLRKYYMADRQRDRVRGVVNILPTDSVSIGIHNQFIRDDYNDTIIGLTSSKWFSTGADVAYAPNERFSAHAFYTFERIKSEQQGWSFQGFAQFTQSVDLGRRWSARDRDKVHTLGAGVSLEIIPDLWSVDCEYLWERTHGQFDVSVGDGLSPGIPYPTNKSELHALSIQNEFEILENLTFRMGYLFQRLRSSDWAIDGVTPSTLEEVVAAGNNSPDYTAHVGTWSLIFRFQ